MSLPPAPMPPPPPPFAPGRPFSPPGAIPVDDYNARAPLPVYHDDPISSPAPLPDFRDDDFDVKPKKTKKNKLNNEPVETQLKGYMLEPAEPLLGENRSWARIGKRTLPFDEVKLQSITKSHRERTRTGPAADFSRLTSKQQGIIDRLVAEHNHNDKHPNAAWILHDVQRLGVWHWRSLEIKKIQVILRRQDKNATKPGDRTTGHTTSSYAFGEIIDLADPLPTHKEKDKKSKKSKKADFLDDDLRPIDDDPLGPGFDNDYAPANDRYDHQQPAHQPPPPPPMPAAGPPYQDPLQAYAPPGAFPVPQTPQPQYQPQYQSQYQPAPNQNPFAPDPPYNVPYEPLPQTYAARQDARSPSPHRRRSPSPHRRRSATPQRRRSSSARRMKKLEHEIEDLKDKVETWRDLGSNSSDSRFEDASVFSPPPSGGSFTPPSTPPRSEAFGPRGSLHQSKERRGERKYRDETRYRGAGRAEIQPAYTPQPRRRDSAVYPDDRERGYPGYRHVPPVYDRRPIKQLHRAQTYDDYPTNRVAEPRYLPPAPAPIQRRLTDFAEAYQPAEFDEQYRRRNSRRQSMAYDEVEDAFERGRREGIQEERSSVPSRRRSVYATTERYYR